MSEALALLDKIIEEHKIILQGFQNLEQVANDTQAVQTIEKAEETFMPGRLSQAKDLPKLEELLNKIENGIKAHFNREEGALLAVFEQYGGKELTAGFRSLLFEHDNFRKRLVETKAHIAQLTRESLSRQQWEATAYDMRAYLRHTRNLLDTHTIDEQRLFSTLKKLLIEKQ